MNIYSKHILIPFAVLLFFFGLTACKTTEKVQSNEHLSKEYFMNFRSSEARLAALLTGKFIQYTKRPSESSYSIYINSTQDSLYHYASLVGNPNKVGYWIYNEYCLSSFQEEPVFNYFIKLERHTNDTLYGHFYFPPKDNPYKGGSRSQNVFKNFNPKNLTDASCRITYIKMKQTEFHSVADICDNFIDKTRKYIYKEETINPDGIYLGTQRKDSKDDFILDNEYPKNSLFKRL